MKKLVLFLTIITTCLLFSCSNNQGTAGKEGGNIIIGVSNDVETFNPLFSESALSQEITHLMLLGLADLDKNSDFSPEIAESWEHSADHMKLTYHLRKDAKWSDGVPITAEDVKFTYDLLMDTTVASPRQGVCSFIKNVVVNDKHSVTFEFTEAYPTQVFDTAGEIVPRHLLQSVDRKELRNHAFGRNPVASGPFKLKNWVSQQYIELVPNEEYFGTKAHFDRVIFKIVPDKTNLLMQLKTGEIDMVSDVPVAEIQSISGDNKELKVYQVDGRVYYFLAYNGKNKLFEEKSVRKALTMALDRQKIIDALLYGYGKPCLGPFPPMLKWAFNKNVMDIPYDTGEAKKILKNIGWEDVDNDGILEKNGQNFEFTIITSTGNQLKKDVAVVAQEQLGKIGVKVNIEILEWTTLIKRLQTKDFDAVVNAWNTSFYVDPTPIFHSESTNLFNFISYSNTKVDQLIETGRVEMDQESAAKIWQEFHEELFEDQPYTFLFWIDKAVVIKSKYQNVTPLALSPVYDLENWYVKQ